jgi:K+-sensing histidine kinase KdpD
MRDDEWLYLADEALEHLLVERWVHRGMLLGVILLSAILVTYLGTHGVTRLRDQVTIGVLLALALVVGGLAFAMRRQDLRIHRELRRRRLAPPGTGVS